MSDVRRTYAMQALGARQAAESMRRRARAKKAEMLRCESEAERFEQVARDYADQAREAKESG